MERTYVSDQELVKQFINGNQSSLEALISRHKDRVYTYILLIVKNQQLAEDLFQDTFVKVIKSLHKGKYRDDGKFIAWVIRIAHNLAIDYFRKEKQLNTVSDEDVNGRVFNSKNLADSTIEDDLIDTQISNDVRNLVDKLPDDQKQVILLRHYGGLSFKEIADQTNVSINTALGRMRYALINLRKLIEEKNLSLTRS
ncbi:MAG: sigma-70 family RNA polymerase sigma factor [Bacteroidales bacterium]|nr:sigma-70 family RNA polymerase sigma factor [Bacteroidales bacterium]